MTKPGYCDGCLDASKEHGCAWSASPNAANTDNAWNVNFNNGNDNGNNKNNNYSVRLVRGECNPCGASDAEQINPEDVGRISEAHPPMLTAPRWMRFAYPPYENFGC